LSALLGLSLSLKYSIVRS